jgi:hypothetical protein
MRARPLRRLSWYCDIDGDGAALGDAFTGRLSCAEHAVEQALWELAPEEQDPNVQARGSESLGRGGLREIHHVGDAHMGDERRQLRDAQRTEGRRDENQRGREAACRSSKPTPTPTVRLARTDLPLERLVQLDSLVEQAKLPCEVLKAGATLLDEAKDRLVVGDAPRLRRG